jgi:IclR family KDG regulon transcriptional repressor
VPQGSVQSIDRVIGLLDALGESSRPLNVRELSTQVQLPRPTIYRLMQTLASHGLVSPAGGGFVLGPRILSLAAQRLEQIELRAVGHERLRELRDQTAETVHLAVLEQGHVVYIDKIESPGPLRMASAVGKIMPAHCTALGKAMLACLPADTARRILHAYGMPRRTVNTITDVPRLMEELTAIRARGFAIDNVENEDGIRCVAAAILDHGGQVAGAVSLSGAISSITLDRARRDLGPRVRAAAQQISRALGWNGPRVSEEG